MNASGILKTTASIVKSAPSLIKNSAIVTKVASAKSLPTILIVVGTGLIIGGTVYACKKTLELPPVIENVKEESEDINSRVDNVIVHGVGEEDHVYNDNDRKRELTKLYFKTASKVLKLYWFAGLLISAGIVCNGLSHGVMNKRLVAATAACEGISQLHNAYRRKVIESEGKEADQKYMHEIIKDQIKPETKDALAIKDANSIINSRKLGADGQIDESNIRIFEEASSTLWRPIAIYNKHALMSALRSCNKILKQRYEDFGYGWLYQWEAEVACGLIPKNYSDGWIYRVGCGDEQVSFGLYDGGNICSPYIDEYKMDFMSGKTCDVMLEFNVIGDIHEILSKEELILKECM